MTHLATATGTPVFEPAGRAGSRRGSPAGRRPSPRCAEVPSSLLLTLAVCLAGLAPAAAQPAPRIGYVYPAGARQGTTVQVTVGGQFLAAVSNAWVSGGGVQATVVEYNRPMNQKEFNDLREEMRLLQEKRNRAFRNSRRANAGGSASTNVWTMADERRLAEIRDKIVKNPPNRNATVAIAETVTLRVRLATNAAPGVRELRLGAPNGLSNPLAFTVGTLPEFAGPPARAANPDAERLLERLGRRLTNAPARTEMRVSLPAVVNGQISPGEVDRYRFTARQGLRLVAVVQARALIPYLADAVPGWFQATLALYDARGRELAYADDFRFHPDPVLYFEIPKDGEYVIEIKDAIYRGREDFVYRMTLGEVPFVTGVFPLGGPAGQTTEVELSGWNLPVSRLTVDNRDRPAGIRPLVVRQDERLSNEWPFAVDTLPELVEREDNNRPQTAQPVALPVLINGRVDAPGDADLFRFTGRAGEEVVAEVQARRLNSPLDSRLQVTDAAGQELAANDDCEDRGAGLTTHQADSYLRVRLPADGTYYVRLTDAPGQGGPEYGYRLRLGPPQPDFALRVVPSTLNARAGGSVPFTVVALRKDGCSNEITLTLKAAPPGFVLSGGRLPAGQDQVKCTVTAPWLAPDEPIRLEIEGRATIAGREVVHAAVPADDWMQAFFYRHLVPAQELRVAVTRGFGRGGVKLLSPVPVKIPVGGTAVVRIDAPTRAFTEQVRLELSDPPEGIRLGRIAPAREGAEITLHAEAGKARPGATGNLIIRALAGRVGAPGKAQRPGNRQFVATLPAIPFEVVEP